MDEILIDEKKYVSSKRAAKVTGYAKDYIGQLCREGRVPARLVGRSWYVLESAIHDHRFGGISTEEEKVSAPEPKENRGIQSTWESPRYEPSVQETLPSINRLRQTVREAPEGAGLLQEESKEQKEVIQHLQNSWQTWFDRTKEARDTASPEETSGEGVEDQTETTVTTAREETPQTLEIESDDGVNIPVHTVYELPPEELLPRRKQMDSGSISTEIGDRPVANRTPRILFSIRIILAIIAAISVAIAFIGAGYLDGTLTSLNRDIPLSGLTVYIK